MNKAVKKALIFALRFAGFCFVFIYLPLELYRLSWPTTAATVVSSQRKWFVSTPLNGRGHPIASIAYEYSVAGKTYANTDFDANGPYGHYNPMVGESDVQAMVRSYPVGRAITIRYKSTSPQISVIRAHRTGGQWAFILAGSFLMGMLLYPAWIRFRTGKTSS